MTTTPEAGDVPRRRVRTRVTPTERGISWGEGRATRATSTEHGISCGEGRVTHSGDT